MIMGNVGLIEKIRKLPPDKVQEIEDFVDFLDQRNKGKNDSGKLGTMAPDLKTRGIGRKDAAQQRAALSSFAQDWERPEMDVYDEL